MTSQPQLVIVGGPNGAGKTTFARHFAVNEGLPYLGADDIAAELSPGDPALVRVAAGRLFSRRLADALMAGQSLVIESTLAGQVWRAALPRRVRSDSGDYRGGVSR